MKIASLLSLAFLITAASAFADPVLNCRTQDKVEGWNAGETNDYVYLTAYATNDSYLSKVEVRGAYESDMRDLQADPTYKPRSPMYKDFNRFGVLEDAWHWFTPVLPQDLTSKRGAFVGYLQISGEEGYKETLKLRCILR